MENLKVKVSTAQESKEAQELFFELGASWCFGCHINDNLPHDRSFILHNFGSQLFWAHTYESKNYDDAKEITLQQLNDMVVLKRNDVGDANYKNIYHERFYVASDLGIYIWQHEKWINHCIQNDFDRLNMLERIKGTGGDISVLLKPIERTMKEYLRKNNDGEYILEVTDEREAQEPHAKHWIEVPKGCDYLVSVFGVNSFIEKSMIHKIKSNKSFKSVLWQRQEQPGELPFIDDEQSINDQYAEIEQVRQQTIEQTLAERQSQYGSFISVANTTGALMSVIKNTKNGRILPHAHEEALHMICSKIARIVNGDYDFLDNWHDIGGYSKLIENLIEGKNASIKD